MGVIEQFETLTFEQQSILMAEVVSNALRYIGLRLPKLQSLVSIRLLGGIGTEAQIQAAKREARNVRFLSPDSAKALASWAAADDPMRFDFEKLVTWYQHFMCGFSDKSRSEVIAKCLSWIEELIHEHQ